MTYLLLANLYLAIFYTFYHFVLRKQTFFRLNRFFLLGSIVLALTLPLANVNTLGQYSQPLLQEMLQKTNTNEALNTILLSPVEIIADPNSPSVEKNGLWIQKSTMTSLYLIGCLLAILTLLIRAKYTIMAFKNPGHKDAFSFFRFVCIGKDLQNNKEIVQHENVHIKEWHSLDIVIIQLLKVFNWFNPFVYALERSIKLQHEYYADQKASGIHQVDYAKLLLASAFDVSPHSLSNQFNHPPLLKSRIMMLLKNRTPKQNLIKILLIIPVLTGMIILSSACQSSQPDNQQSENTVGETGDTSVQRSTIEEQAPADDSLNQLEIPKPIPPSVIPPPVQKPRGSNDSNNDTQRNEQNEVRQDQVRMPTFKVAPKNAQDSAASDTLNSKNMQSSTGEVFDYTDLEISPVPHNDEYKSINEFRQWIAKNFTLPSKAIEADVSGEIKASFIIDESGNVKDVEIIHDIGYGTGEAYKALLEKSLKWKPGIINGQAVAAKYTLPLRINARQ